MKPYSGVVGVAGNITPLNRVEGIVKLILDTHCFSILTFVCYINSCYHWQIQFHCCFTSNHHLMNAGHCGVSVSKLHPL